MSKCSKKGISTLRTYSGEHSVQNLIRPPERFKSADGFFVIAHRGASHYAPENTMPAFKKALRMKADMIELDVLLTRDHIPVVIHDNTLNRTTSGSGPVKQYLYREFQELDAGGWFDLSYKHTRIPSLQAVMRWAKGKISLNIEIKGRSDGDDNTGAIEEYVLDLILYYDMIDRVVVSSFDESILNKIKEINPDIKTALLLSQYDLGSRQSFLKMKKIKADGLNLMPHQMKKKLMKLLAKNHVPVWTYTVNDELDMRSAIRKGATGIFSNRPDLLRRVAIDEFR